MYSPDPGDDGESSMMTGTESLEKKTTGPEFFDRSTLSRKVGLAGVCVAALFGGLTILGGYLIYHTKHLFSSGIAVTFLQYNWEKELLRFLLELTVTICTEATAVEGNFSPNGRFCNVVMGILLVVSYCSSLLVTLSVDLGPLANDNPHAGPTICASSIPLVILGISLLLQATIALASVLSTNILTWSSSPFDITAALVHNAQIDPEPGRCMHGVGDDMSRGPVAPFTKQLSAKSVHPGMVSILLALKILVGLYVLLSVVFVIVSAMSGSLKSWSFFPRPQSPVVAYSIPITDWNWVVYYINMAAIQGPLTLLLHCSELIVNVIRDEKMWRKATTNEGTTISTYPLDPVIKHPLNLVLLIMKPLLHWMLGLGISLAGRAENGFLTTISVRIWAVQIFYYAMALFIFSVVLFVFAWYQPRGPQPAAYGHVQTLANLIDEWSPTMWWGDKGDRDGYRHAGTSDRPLPVVDMDALYA